MDIRIEKFKPVRVAYVRHLGLYEECHRGWKKLWNWIVENEIPVENRLMIGASYDDPQTTPVDQIRYDCCVEVNDILTPDETVRIRTLNGGKFAVYRHKGKYKEIGRLFGQIMNEWLPDSKYEYRIGPCWEIYRGDHNKLPEEERITDLCVPVRLKADFAHYETTT